MKLLAAVCLAAALIGVTAGSAGAAPKTSASKSHKSGHHPSKRHRRVWTRESIWVDKSHQRLYAFAGTRLVMDAKCSTAAHKREWAPGLHRYLETGTPSGNFRIVRKDANHWSRAYDVHMLWSLFFGGGRAIHGTYPSEYNKLGKAASAGCVRLTRSRAKALYRWARVGAHVHIVHSLPAAWASLVHHARSGSFLLHRLKK